MTRESRSRTGHGEASQRLATTTRNCYCPRARATIEEAVFLNTRAVVTVYKLAS